MTMLMMIFIMLNILMMISLLKMSTNMINSKEKLYPFECGFNPLKNPQNPFSIQFFKILLIFLMFDMEIIIVLSIPLMIVMKITPMMMIMYILIWLIIGLIFEWKEGSLNWMK